MMEDYTVFCTSVQGFSHIKENKICQDASGCYEDEECLVIAVADGHGGEGYFRSDIGSAAAVECAIRLSKQMIDEIVPDKVLDTETNNEVMCQLAKSIISEWNISVKRHYTENPFTEAELSGVSETRRQRYIVGKEPENAYGTTLLLVAITPGYWFAIQIGDGSIVAFRNGAGYIAVPKDSKCFLNATTSICDSDAIDEFHWHIGEDIPDGIFIGSDGIEDAYPVNNNADYLYKFYKAIAAEYDCAENIEKFLSEFSEKGSRDDCSVAGAFKEYLF